MQKKNSNNFLVYKGLEWRFRLGFGSNHGAVSVRNTKARTASTWRQKQGCDVNPSFFFLIY